jgi:aldose 1-epimerase
MMKVSMSKFGEMPDGSPVEQFALANANGLVCKAINYGAIVTEVHAPDKSGALADMVLGFDNLEQYLNDRASIGATIGRVINRIAGGKFTLDGKAYALAQNNGTNHLHGGVKGFGKVVWKAEPLELKNGAAVKFTYTSPDGEENYPGTLQTTVVCALTDDNELRLDYEAVTDKPTPVNLSNHSYWNLAGGGDVLGHELMIAARRFTPADDNKIPTGEIKPVAATPLDFTAPKPVGRDIAQLAASRGYDHNFVLDGGGGKLALAARVYEPQTGRVMEVLTDQPAVQLYTANYLKDTRGKRGQLYRQHHAVCLETQHFPDSVHHPHFPSVILRPGEIYRTTTVHRFSTR